MQAPQILKDSPHWILRKGLQPVSISGNAIRWHNPNSWMNYEDACMAYEHHKEQIDGIGYIVTENDDPIDESNNGFVIGPESRFLKEEIVFMGDRIGLEADIDILSEEIGPSEEGKDIEGLLEEVIFLYRGMDPGEPQIAGIYLDNCRDQITGEFSSWARFVLNRLNSPSCINVSGTGFTIFCKCSLPPEYTERTVFGPDDLSEECKANLTKFEPDVALKVAKGESAFNLFKVHQCGPKHFPITGEWLEDYPLEMVDRTREVAEILCLWLPLKLPEVLKSAFDNSGLPHLDILRIIDTSGFTAIGKEFVGQHPLFPAHLKVNPSSNIWYFFHEGSLIMGDAWIWLAGESGAVNWRDIVQNTLFDPAKVQKVKEYAVSKGYFAEDDLLPERKMIRDALQTVADLKDRALSDPGLPFEPQNVQALAIVKISNQAEYERVKGSWKDKISIRELNRSVEEQVCKIRASNILRSEPETMHTDSQMDEKKPIAEQILDTILKGDDSVELWHTVEGKGYASLCYPDGHFEHYALKAKATKRWLGSLYHKKIGKVANSSALNDAITVLEGYAMNGPAYNTYVRVAYAEDAIYIDLGDDTWEAVKITASGWDVVKDVPVKFRRGSGVRALPIPEEGGSVDDLRSILNIKDRKIWILVKGWLIGSLSPGGPYAMLAIVGEQGSAKTWLAKILRSIIDPNELPSKRPPKSTDDLMIAANNSMIVSLDNLSRIKDWLSDDLCNLATGGGLSKRELYSDSEETILHICRPIILNGIEDIVTRQDLLDRAIVAILSRISDDERRPEGELLKKFDQMHPKLLGALLDLAVIGMRNKDQIKLDSLPRMADFARWVAAALGDEGQEFLEAYKENRDCAVKDALEGDPTFVSLKNFLDLKNGKWTGTATELLAALNAEKKTSAGLPRAPNVLSGTLRRLAPALRKVGIEVEFSRDETIASKIVTITRVEISK